MPHLCRLASRVVLAVSGRDRVTFLQGLVSNDVAEAAPGTAVWAAMLTPQGRWLADFFIFADDQRLLLDVEAAQAAEIASRLARFRLRADVQVAPDPLDVYAGWEGSAPPAGLAAPDPRLREAGWRMLAAGLPTTATEADYDAWRIGLGLPDGSRDLEPGKSLLMEAGFDELAGVSWTKGCYLGQELTARTKYRGLVKRRLVRVRADREGLPPPGSPILSDGVEVGQLRSSCGAIGLAILRIDAFQRPLDCQGPVVVELPVWFSLP